MTTAGTSITTLAASFTFGPIQFDSVEWLALVPILGALTVWIGRRSLSGLGSVTRWVALAVRLLVITLISAALAEPQWRDQSKAVAVTAILDVSQSVSGGAQQFMAKYVEDAIAKSKAQPQDLTGFITVAKQAFVQSLPSKLTTRVERQHVGTLDGTNLASGVRLAMAVAPADAANRLVLITDGNETVGSLLQAAEAAKAARVPIDFISLKYKYEGEVLVDRVVAPATARSGENVSIKVAITATRATRGRLSLLMNGEPVDLDSDSSSLGISIELQQGANVKVVTVAPPRDGPQRFEAVFEPEVINGKSIGDTIAENNRTTGVTFVVGQAKVLVLAETTADSEHILRVLNECKINAVTATGEGLPSTLAEMVGYDAIIMVNESASNFSTKQQDDLKQYIHDAGGGLIMIGGPNSFGAGGWIGSPLEDALPIKLDPPQKRQMPKGALALVMHSVEIPEGVYYGKKVCEAAVNALSRRDLAGIIEYNWQQGQDWVYPLREVGDGSAIKKAIQNLVFGDMPDFGSILEQTYKGLKAADAGQKHAIIISDGDPQAPSNALLQKFKDAKISISTVGIACHGPSDQSTLKRIAQFTGGKFYDIPANKVSTLPQIFIKEAQTIKRSLIWEGTPFSPAVTGSALETFRGIGGTVPPITGYVVAADRDGLSLVTLRGKENDPIMAQWQYGLGKTIAYTSEANTRWGASWVAWSNFKQFWEQHIRWAMRPAASPNIRVVTETKGDQTQIIVEALDNKGERLNFANFKGRLATPDGKGEDVELKQVGPGRYETVVPTQQAGSYVSSFVYTAPGEKEGEIIRGSVQAAITRPFADEYRMLEDNEPLLRQVAAMTGGRVLTGDPIKDDLWTRTGLTMPVATKPIWLAVALAAIGLFLVDVGVRRVRIEPRAIMAAVQRLLSPAKRKAGQQMDSLQAARQRARQSIQDRSKADGVQVLAPQLAADTRAVKFEATPAQKARVSAGVGLESPSSPAARTPADAQLNTADKKKPADASGDMSRLLKAKKRANDEMSDQ